MRTVEKSIEIIIVHFTKFEEILACFWARIGVEVDHDITDGRFE